MIEWFAAYKDVLAGVAGIATATAFLVASVTLVVTAFQIRGQRQLSRATAVYQIQSDARALAWQLLSDPDLARAVYGRLPDKQKAAIATAINYYSAVFQMRQYEVLDDHLWNLFAMDFAALLESEQPRKQWAATKKNFDRRFVVDIDSRMIGSTSVEGT
jgi:hypothetical protein